MPKIYGFDTGFVCYTKGWQELRQEDTGLLWEHCVLNEIQGNLQMRSLNYWRDKRGHEIDFVLRAKNNSFHAIECKFCCNEAFFHVNKLKFVNMESKTPRCIEIFKRVFKNTATKKRFRRLITTNDFRWFRVNILKKILDP